MLLLAIFLVFFFSSISELPRSLDLTLDRDPIFLRMAGRETGPVRPAKSRLGDHAKGGKALGPLFPSPCTDTRQSRKTCFSSFFRPSPSARGNPPLERRGSLVKNPRFMREKGTGDCIEDFLSYSRISRPIQHPFNRDRISLKISLYLHTSSPT